MPHAVSMAHSGFQALILCGPGIGLSTFTSVPGEYAKALVEIANRPMVWYVLEWCYSMGVTDITLITPPSSKDSLGAALAQNPHLTSLPSPSPNLLAPADLEHTTPTAELLRLPEVQKLIKRDFLLLPCDLVCQIPGETFLETYLTSLAGLGGIGLGPDSGYGVSKSETNFLGGERSGRRGGLSIWYNTANREESVKKEECDFMCTTKLDAQNCPPLVAKRATKDIGIMRKLAWAMPMSELYDQIEADKDKSWKIRQSLVAKHGSIKVLTQYRDAHIYFFPHWIKDFARLNEDFESVSEDLVGTLAKAEWRSPSYRSRFSIQKIFSTKSDGAKDQRPRGEIPIEEEVDLLSLSSTQTSLAAPRPRCAPHLASRVHTDLDDGIPLHPFLGTYSTARAPGRHNPTPAQRVTLPRQDSVSRGKQQRDLDSKLESGRSAVCTWSESGIYGHSGAARDDFALRQLDRAEFEYCNAVRGQEQLHWSKCVAGARVPD
ncbi:hypothetical protein DV737_g4837, partial [Chaetothyriales sp. CBS 132003]